jgi:protein SCO1/2
VIRIHAPLRALALLAMLAAVTLVSRPASADPLQTPTGLESDRVPPELQGIEVQEHLGGQLPLDAQFRDADGNAVTLGKYFDHKRPVLLVFAYHSCPMLCSLVLDSVAAALKDVPWTVGKEFDVVSISFDPHDTPQTASAKRAQLVEKYGRSGTEGWNFLVGDDRNIRQATGAVGFQYRWDERQKMYAHPAAIYLLTPDGKIARYLYSISFDPEDIRYGLLEASQGRSITTTERFLIWCYHYDPQGGRYTLAAMNIMRLGGAVTVALIGGLLAFLWRREKRKKGPSPKAPSVTPVTPVAERAR